MSVRRAFTLVEVVLAIGLLLALAGSIAAFAWNLALRRAAFLEAAAELDAGTRALDALEQALATSVAVGDGARPGLVGDGSSIEVSSRGTRPMLASEPAAALGDAQRLRVSHDAARATLTVEFESAGRTQRVELPRVARVRLRYYDGAAWASDFESAPGAGLPVAIEIALWFGEPAPTDGESEAGEPATSEPIAPDARAPEPDRLRVIAIPDAWAEGGL